MTNINLSNLKYICFFICFLTVQMVYAHNSPPCAKSFTDVFNSFAESMTQNGHLNEHQSDLFQIYRANGFGDPKYNTHGYNMKAVFRVLKKHPKLLKLPVREQIIRFEQQFAERDENLNELVNQFKKMGLNLIQNLFQIDDNLNFWNHILAFRQPPSAVGLTKTQKRELKQQHHQEFLSYLNDFIDKDKREFISNPSNHYRVRIITLYKSLEQARERLKQSGKNIHPISQAMVNLIAGAGFLNQDYLDMLNSSKDVIAGVQRILQEKEDLAVDLNFDSEGFLELKKFLEVSDSFQDISSKIENHLLILTDQTQTLRLRALSLQESPFRSCLSRDCTTWMYFKLGLHPSFLFFTLTDEYNRSSGQITVVLGYAKDRKGRWVKTAFVDNIHNVPLEKIVPMLEGIRLGLSEYGYRLALSGFTEQVKKLSNEKIIRNYVNKEILPHLTSSLNQFMISMPRLFNKSFYREYESIKMVEFERLPVQKDHRFTITPGEKYSANSIHEDLSIESFKQAFFELERSKTEEHQMNFLDNIPMFIHEPNAGPIIKKRLLNNIQDKEITFSIRKRSLYDLFSFFPSSISLKFVNPLLNYFTEKERKEILGEWYTWTNIFTEQLKKDDVSLSFLEFFIEKFGMDIFLSSHPILNRIFVHTRIDTLKMLIKKGFNVNIKLNDGSSPLHLAANRTFFSEEEMPKVKAMIQLLINHGADINAREDKKNFSPLHLAVSANSITTDIAKLLIENGADVNAKSSDGFTPRQLAKLFKHKKMVKLLDNELIYDDKNLRDTLKIFIQKLIATAIIFS